MRAACDQNPHKYDSKLQGQEALHYISQYIPSMVSMYNLSKFNSYLRGARPLSRSEPKRNGRGVGGKIRPPKHQPSPRNVHVKPLWHSRVKIHERKKGSNDHLQKMRGFYKQLWCQAIPTLKWNNPGTNFWTFQVPHCCMKNIGGRDGEKRKVPPKTRPKPKIWDWGWHVNNAMLRLLRRTGCYFLRFPIEPTGGEGHGTSST
jgi:hypothetical protein